MYTHMHTRVINVHPEGVHIWVPFRAPIRAGSPKGGRATKEKINRDLSWVPLRGTHMHTPKGCALMGWVPYPAHMGPRFAGPITALRAFKKKNVMMGAGVRVNMWAHQPSNRSR